MRRACLAIALGGIAILAAPATPARAACVPAGISVLPVSGPRGSAFVVTGRGFYRGCSDLLSNPTPDRGIRLEFVSDLTSTPLATVDARSDGSFEHQATVPADAAPGQATVRAVGSSSTQSTTFLVTAAVTSTTSTSVARTTSSTGRTTSTVSRSTTTSSTEVTPETLAPQLAPEIDPPGSATSDSTLASGRAAKRSSDDDDWGATAYIVGGIVFIGAAIAGVSARLYRHLGPPPPP